GGVFDGLLRPLAEAPVWLAPGTARHARDRVWSFVPTATAGELVGPGTVLGTVTDAGPVAHRVLVPPGVTGRLEQIRPADPAAVGVVLCRGGAVAAARPAARRPRPR